MADLPHSPFLLFGDWYQEAQKSEINDPGAMALSLIDSEDRPSVRIVLMRKFGPYGFEFFTNYESAKGQGLSKHPDAEICFYWKSLHKQIRIRGKVEKTSPQESDDYFHARPRGSRIGAWASQQTRPLASFEELEKSVAAMEQKFEGQDFIPRPDYWGGFRIVPDRMEFWEEQPFRLHKRFVYVKHGDTWAAQWLYP